MDRSSIEKELNVFLENNILAEDVVITSESEFKEMGVDSYSIVEVVLFIERKFGIIIPDIELTPENFENVSSIAKVVQAELAKF